MNPIQHDPRALLLTIPQVAERLSVQPSTVLTLMKKGELSFSKFGFRDWRIRESDLIDWIDARDEMREQQQTPPTSESAGT